MPHAFLRRSGDGPPMLLLHGNPDTGAMWSAAVERLQDRFTCLVPDLPGFGGSPAGPRDVETAGMAAWVDGVLDQAAVDGPVHVVAHDFGGPYGCAFAVLHTDRVASISLTNTLFFAGVRWHFWARVWRTPVLGELATLTTPYALFRREMLRGSPGLSEEHLRSAYQALTPATRKHVLRLYRAHPPDIFTRPVPGREQSWAQAFQQVAQQIPSQVLWGERDPYLGADNADRFGADRVVRFADSGHWLPAEDPDGFCQALVEGVTG